MAENWKDTLTDKLCDAFLKLETRQEVYDFLEDVATIGEIKEQYAHYRCTNTSLPPYVWE